MTISRCVRAVALLTMAGVPGFAQAAHYGLKPIAVPGAVWTNASAVNNHSSVAGWYYDGTSFHAFLMDGGQVTTLPDLCPSGETRCLTAVTALTPGGAVGGYYFVDAYDIIGFIWKNGVYQSSSIGLGSYNGGPQRLWLNDSDSVAFNYVVGDGVVYPYAGPASAPARLTGAGSNATITSLNQAGDVAGLFITYVGNTGVQAALTDIGGTYETVLPPRAFEVDSALLNSSHEVAGTFRDAAGRSHGYIYRPGHYVTFGFPKGATRVLAQAVNQSGHVVGTFVDAATGATRVFVYTGARLNVFGAFAAGDVVSTAMNDQGEIVIADSSPTTVHSYRALCGGTGC